MPVVVDIPRINKRETIEYILKHLRQDVMLAEEACKPKLFGKQRWGDFCFCILPKGQEMKGYRISHLRGEYHVNNPEVSAAFDELKTELSKQSYSISMGPKELPCSHMGETFTYIAYSIHINP